MFALSFSPLGWSATVRAPGAAAGAAARFERPLVMNEAAAKAAWLASLDQPSWGPKAAAVSATAAPDATTPFSAQSEAAAKAAWLASLDNEPSWLGAATPTAVASGAPPASLSEAEAKAPPHLVQTRPLRRARYLHTHPPGMNRPSGLPLSTLSHRGWAAWVLARPCPKRQRRLPLRLSLRRPLHDNVITAHGIQAKWLASLETQPSWLSKGPAAAPAPAFDAAPPLAAMSEDAAKAAWLASLDSTPSWLGKGSAAPAAASAPDMSGSVVPTSVGLSEADAKVAQASIPLV